MLCQLIYFIINKLYFVRLLHCSDTLMVHVNSLVVVSVTAETRRWVSAAISVTAESVLGVTAGFRLRP